MYIILGTSNHVSYSDEQQTEETRGTEKEGTSIGEFVVGKYLTHYRIDCLFIQSYVSPQECIRLLLGG